MGSFKTQTYKNLNNLVLAALIQIMHLFFTDLIGRHRNRSIRASWRRMNKHNHTSAANNIHEMSFPLNKVSVGKYSYGPLCVHHFGNVNERLIIGNYCSISNGVKFILGGDHPVNCFSTFAFDYFFKNEKGESSTKGPIIVGDDVWIGTDAIILSGVTLAKGTVVAAGSIVTKTTLPYSIVGGNPARLIKKRFDDELIDELAHIDFGILNESKVLAILPKLHLPLDKKLLAEIKNELFAKNLNDNKA